MIGKHKRANSVLVKVISLAFFIALSVNVCEDLMEVDLYFPCESIWEFRQECWLSSEDDTFDGLGVTPYAVMLEPTSSFASKTSSYIPEKTYLSQINPILRC